MISEILQYKEVKRGEEEEGEEEEGEEEEGDEGRWTDLDKA